MWVHSWVKKMPWRRKWQPTPVYLEPCLENSTDVRAPQATVHGVTKESDTTQQLNNNDSLQNARKSGMESLRMQLGCWGSALSPEPWIPERIGSNPPFACLKFFYALHGSIYLFTSAETMTQAGPLPTLSVPLSHSKIALYKRLYPVTEILLKIGGCISHFKKLKI